MNSVDAGEEQGEKAEETSNTEKKSGQCGKKKEMRLAGGISFCISAAFY